jgi:gliding motility-associated-like protein
MKLNPFSRGILFALLFLGTMMPAAFATHIVGGELNYRYLGNNLYEIRLTVYRDCYNGIPAFDNPASLGVFSAFNNFIVEIPMVFTGSDTIPPTINSPCFIPPTNICYERTTYIDTIALPPSPNGYQLAYQRCCRNYTIINIIQPDATGATYYANIPGTSTFSQNSNPVFNNWPPPFICAGIPFIFDHSATDAEGDSIVYEICTPYNGADTLNPRPQPPNNPPYPNVIFQPPYSNTNLLGGVPLNINPQTGQITALPGTVGQFVVGICAKEFRNGIYLSTTRRDFQLNVVPCPTLVVAALQYPLISCGSNTVQFVNQSLNAGTYLWDFGLPGNTDTSTAVSPVFTYPDTGSYPVTLIAYSNVNPLCADTTTGIVTLLPDFIPDFSFSLDTCTNTFSFRDTSNSQSGRIIFRNWNFGDGSTSNDSTPVHTYAPGTYNVRLIAESARGCIDTVIKVITVNPLVNSVLQTSNVRCISECNAVISAFPSAGYPPFTWQWNDPLNQNTFLADSLCPGTYQVLITDRHGCTALLSASVSEPDSLRLSINVTPAYCRGNCIGSADASVSGGNGGYQFLWTDPQQQTTPKAGSLCEGSYNLTVTDARGCQITATADIVYSDSLPQVNADADTNFIYVGQGTFLHATPVSGNAFQWEPATPLNNAGIADPYASPRATTIFTVTVTDANQCTNQDTVTIFVNEILCAEPELFIPNAFSPDNDGNNDVFRLRGNTLSSMHLEIYDRWGEKIFETDDLLGGWNGNYKGKEAEPGVYVYFLRAICYDQSEFTKQGNVTLLR